MPQVVIAFLAVLLVGVGIAVETPTNALLGKTLGSVLLASFVSFVVGTALLGVALLAVRPKLPAHWLAETPWYAWIGGAYGALLVLLSAWATPKLGAGATLVIIVASQVALGVALDHFGVLGLSPHPATALRLGGCVVVAAGAAMIAKS